MLAVWTLVLLPFLNPARTSGSSQFMYCWSLVWKILSIMLEFTSMWGECTEKAMAPHSSTLAWKIPWMEEPGRLQSMGSLRVQHDWATSLSLSLSCVGEGNGNPLQCSCLENTRDGRAWWAATYGVTQSRTRLKWLSNSRGECNCAVVWAFFGFAFLWDWNENWPFPVLWPLLCFPNLLAYWVQHFHSIIVQDLE